MINASELRKSRRRAEKGDGTLLTLHERDILKSNFEVHIFEALKHFRKFSIFWVIDSSFVF